MEMDGNVEKCIALPKLVYVLLVYSTCKTETVRGDIMTIRRDHLRASSDATPHIYPLLYPNNTPPRVFLDSVQPFPHVRFQLGSVNGANPTHSSLSPSSMT
jgi:hypothetical protein